MQAWISVQLSKCLIFPKCSTNPAIAYPARPNPAVQDRNLAFLNLTLGVEMAERCASEINDLLTLDSGSWGQPYVVHHCKGIVCCKSHNETRAKLWNAIMVAGFLIHKALFDSFGTMFHFPLQANTCNRFAFQIRQ